MARGGLTDPFVEQVQVGRGRPGDTDDGVTRFAAHRRNVAQRCNEGPPAEVIEPHDLEVGVDPGDCEVGRKKQDPVRVAQNGRVVPDSYLTRRGPGLAAVEPTPDPLDCGELAARGLWRFTERVIGIGAGNAQMPTIGLTAGSAGPVSPTSPMSPTAERGLLQPMPPTTNRAPDRQQQAPGLGRRGSSAHDTGPSRVVRWHGRRIRAAVRLLVEAGTFTRLSDARPSSYWARSDPGDVARVEDRTFICSRPKATPAPPTTGGTRRDGAC